MKPYLKAPVSISVVASNSPPFIVDDAVSNPQPDITTNPSCDVFAVVSHNDVPLRAQTALSQLQIWDRNIPNPGPWAAPFIFATYDSSSLWEYFSLNTVTGAITLPSCNNCSQFAVGQIFSGLVSVTDQGGASSLCTVTINVTENNSPPVLSPFTTTGVSQQQSKWIHREGSL